MLTIVIQHSLESNEGMMPCGGRDETIRAVLNGCVQYRLQSLAAKREISVPGRWEPITHQTVQREISRHRACALELGPESPTPRTSAERRHHPRQGHVLRHDRGELGMPCQGEQPHLAGKVQAKKSIARRQGAERLRCERVRRWPAPGVPIGLGNTEWDLAHLARQHAARLARSRAGDGEEQQSRRLSRLHRGLPTRALAERHVPDHVVLRQHHGLQLFRGPPKSQLSVLLPRLQLWPQSLHALAASTLTASRQREFPASPSRHLSRHQLRTHVHDDSGLVRTVDAQVPPTIHGHARARIPH